MGSRQRRGGAEKGKEGADRKMIETIREATGATEDDIRVMLEECNFDANETTSRLIDNPFSQVQSKKDKKKKRDEDRKKDPPSKVMEIRRNSSTGGRGRGHDRERGPRGDRGSERGNDRGPRHQANVPANLPPLTVKEPPQSTEEDSSQSTFEPQRDHEPLTDRPVASSGGWGEIGSKPTSQAQQPIGKPTLPAPIRPPGSQSTKPSMADLFKKKPAERESAVTQPVSSTLNQPPASSHSLGQGQESNLYSAPQESSSDANGWGPSHSLEPDTSRQGSSLGGVAIEAPKKSSSAQQQPIQAGSAGSGSIFPSQTPVGSLGNAPPSPQRTKQEDLSNTNAWGIQSSSAGLGGVPVEAPPRQHSQIEQPQRSNFEQPQRSNFTTADQPSATAWAPKTSAPAGSQSLGGSILNSIPPQSYSSAHSNASDALPSSSPRAPQQQGLGNSHSTFGQSPMVIPSPNHQTSKDLNSATIQFGGFSLGNTGQDLGGFTSPAFPSAFERTPSSQAELPATLGPSASEPFKPATYSQHLPPTSLAQSQQQRAYNAFTSAGQPQTQTQSLASGQRSSSHGYAPETSSSSTTSHPLYGQGYQNYGAGGQSFNQYQPSSHQQAYQNYNAYQAPAEAEAKPAAGSGTQATSQAAPTAAVKSNSTSYDPSQSYPQYTSQHTATAKEYQPAAAKYSNPNPSHMAAAAPVSGHNLSQVVSQTPLTVPSGYGAGQNSSLQQGYGGYGGQQGYGSNYQQYNNYVGSGGYGGYNQRSSNPYQQAQGTGYGQAMKGYGGAGNYGAGGYQQQHTGAYGAATHKADKDHLASHMGAPHNLYGQQQLPLSSQSHLQAGLPANNQGYNQGYGNYSNANQGYNNYGMGGNRQYSNQY